MDDWARKIPACWRHLGNSDLVHCILETPLCDTHEHLRRHHEYRTRAPDILGALFDNYVLADLVVAGADDTDAGNLTRAEAGTVADRFRAVETAWRHVQYTGYGEAVRLIAEHFHDLPVLTPEALAAAQACHEQILASRSRLQILQEDAGLDHVQINDFGCDIIPDEEDAAFFLYDMSLLDFASGEPDLGRLHELTGIEVLDLSTYQAALESVFAQHAAEAVACKTQHAYNRTLAWQKRDRSDVAGVLERYLRAEAPLPYEDRLLLGDWGLDLCAALAREHDRPIKIHTGYYAGHSRMPLDFIAPGHLDRLLQAHLGTRFILMHNGYPFGHELVALAKHYPNVFVDMCWAWSIDPHAARTMLRHCLHAVPLNRVFAFGGDTSWAFAAYAYAMQARWGLTRALQAEVADGCLQEKEAMAVAERVMYRNQYDCFARLGQGE